MYCITSVEAYVITFLKINFTALQAPVQKSYPYMAISM